MTELVRRSTVPRRRSVVCATTIPEVQMMATLTDSLASHFLFRITFIGMSLDETVNGVPVTEQIAA